MQLFLHAIPQLELGTPTAFLNMSTEGKPTGFLSAFLVAVVRKPIRCPAGVVFARKSRLSRKNGAI